MNEKAQHTTIERNIGRTHVRLNKTQKEMNDASQAAHKLTQSVSKRIEYIVIAERPDRYVSFGLRKWALLNRCGYSSKTPQREAPFVRECTDTS